MPTNRLSDEQKAELRELVNDALAHIHNGDDQEPYLRYIEGPGSHPESVLALLDELAAKDKRIAELEGNLEQAKGYGEEMFASYKHLDDKLDAVRELHYQSNDGPDLYCGHCGISGDNGDGWPPKHWPCPTMKIVEGP